MGSLSNFLNLFKMYSDNIKRNFFQETLKGKGLDSFYNEKFNEIKSIYNDFDDEPITKEDISILENYNFYDIKLMEFLGFGIQTSYKIVNSELKNKKVVLYGAGKMASDFYEYSEISNYCNIVDWVAHKTNSVYPKCRKITTELLESLTEYDYVLVAISNIAVAMSRKKDLMNLGIAENKIIITGMDITFTRIGRKYEKNEKKSYKFEPQRENFLIVGAQFHNSGAQSMLFCTITEIKKRFPNSEIWYLPIDDKSYYTDEIVDKYNFHIICDDLNAFSEIIKNASSLNGIVDISGYALHANSNRFVLYRYVFPMLIGYLFNVPVYLMPQSFGKFQYTNEAEKLLQILLSNCKRVFAREEIGRDELKEKYDLNNIELSCDLVLQSDDVDKKQLLTEYNEGTTINELDVDMKNCVAIVPNVRNYEFGEKKRILFLYKILIEKLLSFNKMVYIIMHSTDEAICDDIFSIFSDNPKVKYIKKELGCIEYNQYIKKFDYAIVSRYHGIVHAYNQFVPCILIGWDYKYRNLANIMEQDLYFFDVREDINFDDFTIAVERMEQGYKKEKTVINNRLSEIKKKSCFDFLCEDY